VNGIWVQWIPGTSKYEQANTEDTVLCPKDASQTRIIRHRRVYGITDTPQ
jgi:hypothetical protein